MGRVDRVKDEEGISQQGGDEGAFGLLQAESDLLFGEALGQRGRPLRDRFRGVLQGGTFVRAARAIVETEGMRFASPVQPDEGRKVLGPR